MTFTITFEPIASTEAETQGKQLANEPEVAIWHDHFQAMVTIEAGDGKIFHGSCPLFFMAWEGTAAVEELAEARSADLFIPERAGLRLSLVDDDRVAIESIDTGKKGFAGYGEVREAWNAFSEKARRYLLDLAPDMVDHPSLGPWFRGEED